MQADTLLADKAFDARKRAMEPLLNAGKTPVIPSMPGRRHPRPSDRDLFGARHLNRVISTRYDERAVNFPCGRLCCLDFHGSIEETR
jgi:hypothetical protein